MKILWEIILKYLAFNTYTLVALRKKIAPHTCTHQWLGTHCCVQRHRAGLQPTVSTDSCNKGLNSVDQNPIITSFN